MNTIQSFTVRPLSAIRPRTLFFTLISGSFALLLWFNGSGMGFRDSARADPPELILLLLDQHSESLFILSSVFVNSLLHFPGEILRFPRRSPSALWAH